MALLIAGLVLFLGIHTLGTLREQRAAVIGRLGEGPYKGLYSIEAGANNGPDPYAAVQSILDELLKDI